MILNHLTRKSWLAGVLILSVALRLVVALYLGNVVEAPPMLKDQSSYHILGARLIKGHGFSFEQDWYPFTPANTPTAHWSFLYSLFVAGVYALFGVHPLAVRIVQAVLGGVLLPWMVYRLARRLFASMPLEQKRTSRDEFVSLVAAAIAAVYGYFVLYSATLMTETFFITIVLWSLEVSLRIGHRLYAREPVSLGLGLQLGVSLGLAAVMRQSILPWVPLTFLYLVWLAWRGRQLVPMLRVLLLTGILLVACIAPFTIRNYVVYGHFMLLNSNTGYAMYSAQHPMHGTNFREFDAAPLPEDLPRGNEALMDRALMRVGLRFILEEPGRYLLLSLSRVRAFFEFWPTPDTTLLHNVGRTGSFGLFLPFMVYGTVAALRSSRFVGRNGLLLLFCAFYTILHVLTWAMVRYRLPVDAALMPLAALALVDVARRVRAATRGRACQAGTDKTYEAGLQEIRL